LDPQDVSQQVRIYEPGCRNGWGPAVWRGMASDLWDSRELAWRLLVRNFVSRYKQTLLGLAGAVVTPLLSAFTFILLQKMGVLNTGDTAIPYPAYAFLSLTIWIVFSDGIPACANALVQNTNLVVKVNFPKETLVIGALGQVFIAVCIRAVLVLIVFAIYRVVPAWTVVLAPLALIPLFLLTLGLGMLLAVSNALVRDIGSFVSVGITFVFFITPVMYMPPENSLFEQLSRWNPLAGLVLAPRDLIISGTLSAPEQYAWASALSVVVFLLGWRVFHLASTRFAERMGA
jgi:homopolymeric O-antigen transport system permease protein